MKKKITVSIVTYHSELTELKFCLDSLSSDLVDRIYIIDNSNQRYIEHFCQKSDRGRKVIYIASPNVGYGAGHNKALETAISSGLADYHLVLNPDVRFQPEILEHLVGYMEKDRSIGLMQPYVEYPDGKPQLVARMLPTPANLIFRRFLPRCFKSSMDCKYTLAFRDLSIPANIPYLQGSFMFFRISALLDVGLFDERFFLYAEDVDITRRMHRAYKTMYWPMVRICHSYRRESYKRHRMMWIHVWNMIKYFNKWGWFFDRERRGWNKQLLDELGYHE